MFAIQRKLVFKPDTTAPDIAAAGILLLSEVYVETLSGLRLLAWYLPAQPGMRTLAYFHGNGGNLENRVPRFRRASRIG